MSAASRRRNRGNTSHDSFYGDPSDVAVSGEKQLAAQRQSLIRDLWSDYERAEAKLLQLVAEARGERDWEHLGYKSWTAYLADTVGKERVKLAAGRRQELVGMLSAEGMSTRAIATTIGVSVGTVHADRQVFNSEHLNDGAAPTSASSFFDSDAEYNDVMVMSSVGDQEFETAIQQAMSEGDVSRENVARIIKETAAEVPERITGLDGKTYAKPKVAAAPTKPPRRRPLPEAYRSALYDLGKVAERIDRLTTDDRFKSHLEEYRTIWGNDLLRSVKSLTASLEPFHIDGDDAPAVEAM